MPILFFIVSITDFSSAVSESFHPPPFSFRSIVFPSPSILCFSESVSKSSVALHSFEEVKFPKLSPPHPDSYRLSEYEDVAPSLVFGTFPQASFYYALIILCILWRSKIHSAASLGCVFCPHASLSSLGGYEGPQIRSTENGWWMHATPGPVQVVFNQMSLQEGIGILYTYLLALSPSEQMWLLKDYHLKHTFVKGSCSLSAPTSRILLEWQSHHSHAELSV